MKLKKFAITALTVAFSVCAFGLIVFSSGCIKGGHKHNYEKKENGSTFIMECSCGEKKGGFMIQFVYEDGSTADEGIEVSWIDDSGKTVQTATTNAIGYVEAGELSGESYKISVKESTLPVFESTNYQYNKYAFNEQTNGVGLIIPLFRVYDPTNAGAELDGNKVVTGRPNTSGYTSDVLEIELDKTYLATLNSATDEIWYRVTHKGFGNYEVDATMAGDIAVSIDKYGANMAYIPKFPETGDDIDKSETNKLGFKVGYPYRESTSTFCFKVPNATSYPVSIPFVITITYKAEDTSVKSTTLVKPTHFETAEEDYVYYYNNERHDEGEDALEERTTPSLIPVAGTQKWKDAEGAVLKNLTQPAYESMTQGADGYYYTGSQIVLVKLKVTSIFESFTLQSHLQDSNGQLTIYLVTEYDDYERCIRSDNYFGFIQAYSALASEKGVYPLTAEMLEYLEYIAGKEHRRVYELLCTSPVEAKNFTEGNGSEANPYSLDLSDKTFGNYSISIPEGGKVYLNLNTQSSMYVEFEFNSNVKVSVVGYTSYEDYIAVNGTSTVIFESKDGSAQTCIIGIKEYKDTYYLELGDNEVSAKYGSTMTHVFTATTAGDYDIVVNSQTVTVTVIQGGTPQEITGGTLPVTLAENETITIEIETELDGETPFTLSILEKIDE